MSAVTLQKFVLLQENKVLEQFVRHRSMPAVHLFEVDLPYTSLHAGIWRCGLRKADAAAACILVIVVELPRWCTNCRAVGFRFSVVKLAFMSMTV